MKSHQTFRSLGKPPVDPDARSHLPVLIALAAVALLVVIGCDPTTPVPPDTKPSVSGTVADQTYTVGEAINTLTLPAATGGNGDLTYSLQPTVPGLTFNASTRTLTGTPRTAGTYPMTYRVVDADDNTSPADAATLSFQITVNEAAPADTAPRFTDTVAGQTYTAGEPISTLTLPAATGGNGALIYTLEPKVPELTFDPHARTLSGTPTTAGTYAMTYRVVDTDENTEDSDAATLSFTIMVQEPAPAYVGTWHFVDLPAPATAILAEARFTVIVGDEVSGIVTETPFDQVTRLTVTGTLAVQGSTFTLTVAADGVHLTFAAGVTTAQQAATTESVTALLMQADDEPLEVTIADEVMTVRGGFVETVLMMRELTAMAEGAPRFESTMTDQSLTVGEPVGILMLPAATGGNGPLRYTLEPQVPGLSFDGQALTLSGTPTVIGTYQMTYRVEDADINIADSDAATQVFIITVRELDSAPVFDGTVEDQTYTQGQRIEDLRLPAASGGNGALTYTLEPRVPDLIFAPGALTLSGTPTAAGTYAMTYTVTDADDNAGADDEATLSFTITVQRDPDDLFPGPNTFAEVTEYETITLSPDEGPITVARNELLVYLSDDVTTQEYDAIAAKITELGGQVVGSLEEMQTLQVRVPEATDELDLAESLVDYAGFEAAGYNFIWEAEEDSDIRLSSVESAPDFSGAYWISQIGADAAWKYTQGSSDTKAIVGIVDTGIPTFRSAPDGPFGSGRLSRYNKVGEYVLDSRAHMSVSNRYHGAYVACMAAAYVRDSSGAPEALGVAHKNRIVSVDAVDHEYSRSEKKVYFHHTTAYDAVKTAVQLGADVVNISIGPEEPEKGASQYTYQDFRISNINAILYAKKNDVLLVFASGNEGFKEDNALFESSLQRFGRFVFGTDRQRRIARATEAWSTHVLTVGAVGAGNVEWPKSVMGDVVDITAPGWNVGCGLDRFWNEVPARVSGTSVAAPLVAGTAALMRSADTSLKAPEIRSIILRTATRNVDLLPGTSHPGIQLNACMAVAAVKDDNYAGDTWPNFGKQTIEDMTFTVNEAIDPEKLPDAICHNDKLHYLLTYGEGQQVPGLDFSLSKRVMSGTPTEAGTYLMTYTVADLDTNRPEGIVDESLTFTIAVVDDVEEVPDSLVGWKFENTNFPAEHFIFVEDTKVLFPAAGGFKCGIGKYSKIGDRSATVNGIFKLYIPANWNCNLKRDYELRFDERSLTGTFSSTETNCYGFVYEPNYSNFRLYAIGAGGLESYRARYRQLEAEGICPGGCPPSPPPSQPCE